MTVTAASPALQGIRRAQTNDDGHYTLPLLPPGDYVLSYALDGLETQERSLRVSVAQSTAGDVEMAAATLAETIAVTGTAEAISTGGTAATTFTKSFVEELPIQRNLRETTLLTAGVSSTGPSQAITISGAYSFQSLFLIDGVVVNENLRGQPQNLFIEDAIDQTTTLTSGISAEYGRFSGGVVNMLTKSGGNDFSGTFRTSVTNDDWTAPTPVTVVDPTDKENYRYEATLGGRFVRDRLWYFAAARKFELTTTEQTARLDQPYTVGTDELRPQLKLTAALTRASEWSARISRSTTRTSAAISTTSPPTSPSSTTANCRRPSWSATTAESSVRISRSRRNTRSELSPSRARVANPRPHPGLVDSGRERLPLQRADVLRRLRARGT